MPSPRSLPTKSFGQHLGYAVEAHFRGILKRSLPSGYELGRTLPFEFPVKPDAVVLDSNGRIALLGIVAVNQTSANSNMKYYRTRLEYHAALEKYRTSANSFSRNFVCLVFLYGVPGGWKEKILIDLSNECRDFLYLPSFIGDEASRDLVNDIFSSYRTRWEAGHSDATEYVERLAASKLLAPDSCDAKIATVLSKKFRSRAVDPVKRPANRPALVRNPIVCEPFRSRVRQGLSLASLFSNDELTALYEFKDSLLPDRPSLSLTELVRKIVFLDLGRLSTVRSISRPRALRLTLRRAERLDRSGANQFDPSKADFSMWLNIEQPIAAAALGLHRGLPLKSPKVFAAGAADQIASNWRGYCAALVHDMSRLEERLEAGDPVGLADTLAVAAVNSPADWHPCRHASTGWPLIEFTLAMVDSIEAASHANDDADSQAIRSIGPADTVKIANLSRRLIGIDRATVSVEIANIDSFCKTLSSGLLGDLVDIKRPMMFALDNRASWLNAVYRGITTNKTHNPCLGPVYEWLLARYPDYIWYGWPKKRSIALKSIFSSYAGRLQWQMVGAQVEANSIVLCEARSITENNWGNKSKELFDRCRETRHLLRSQGIDAVTLICVLDGDLTLAARSELIDVAAFDEVWSVEHVFSQWHTRLK